MSETTPRIVLQTASIRAVLIAGAKEKWVVVENCAKDSMNGPKWTEWMRWPESSTMFDLMLNGICHGAPVSTPKEKVEADEDGRKKFTLELTKHELAILRYVISRVGNDDSDPLKDTYEMEDEPEDKYAVLDEVHDKVMMLRWLE